MAAQLGCFLQLIDQLDSGHNCCLGSNGERIRQFLFSPGPIHQSAQTDQSRRERTSWGCAGVNKISVNGPWLGWTARGVLLISLVTYNNSQK